MGVRITPLVVEKTVGLEDLSNRTLAFDAYNEMHRFLALVRSRDGTPLQDREGQITSHLNGLMLRVTRLVHDFAVRLIYVFDGPPPSLKREELERRRRL